MDLQKLSQEAFETAKAHGWHDIEQPDETYLMLIITEIAEAVQADRKDRHADVKFFRSLYEPDVRIWISCFENYIKNSVEDELSDVLIRCLDLAALRGVSFSIAETSVAEFDGKMKETSFPEHAYYLCALASCSDETLEGKLNMIVVLVILYCRQNCIDIDFFVEQKMRYNKLRPFRHGNKKY